MGQYRCEATSIAGFVQQIATCYLRHGYFFAAVGLLPAGKDPATMDRKQIGRYRLEETTPMRRFRRKRHGLANVQYIRFERLFAILATEGEHCVFRAEEGHHVRDLRRAPLMVGGYAISVRRRHVCVRIADGRYRELKAALEELATKRSADELANLFAALPYDLYAPVRAQLCGILESVNARRRRSGMSAVPSWPVRGQRRSIRPFDPVAPAASNAAPLREAL